MEQQPTWGPGSRTGVPPALRELPEWWLGELDHSLARGDFEAAAHAARHLRELGVEVRYTRMRAVEVTP